VRPELRLVSLSFVSLACKVCRAPAPLPVLIPVLTHAGGERRSCLLIGGSEPLQEVRVDLQRLKQSPVTRQH